MKSPFRLAKSVSMCICACTFVFTALVGSHSTAHASASAGRETFGFAPYWALNGGEETQWNYNVLHTFSYFSINFLQCSPCSQSQPDGALDITSNDRGYTTLGSYDFNLMMQNAKSAGDRALLTITAQDPTDMLRDPAAIPNIVSATMMRVQQYGFNGVTIDFEGNASCSDLAPQQGLTNLVQAFRTAMNNASPVIPNSELVLASYTGSAVWNCGFINVSATAPSVDAFFVMAYDMAGSNMGPMCAGPNSPINGWTYNDTMALYGNGSQPGYISQAGANKVILGVPYYGYKCSVSNPSAYASATSGAAADTYSGILGDMNCGQNLSTHWDPVAMEPWIAWYSPSSGDPCGGNLGTWRELYYDNAQSLCYKYNLVQNANIRGAGVWALGYDSGSNDLWNQMLASFGNSNTVPTNCGIAAQTGTLTRYYQPGAGHWVTTSNVTSAYDLGPGFEEGPMGSLAMIPSAGMQALYSCQAGSIHFLTLDSGCEGQTTIELDGYSSITSSGAYTVQVFRCRVPGSNDHFVSWDPGCEGQTSEGSLGYVSPAITITRYYGNGNHVTLSGAAPSGYQGEQQYTGLSATSGTPIYLCKILNMVFSSSDKNCEGQGHAGLLGYSSQTGTPLYRCYLPADYDHFDTPSPTCEGAPGAQRDSPTGYVSG